MYVETLQLNFLTIFQTAEVVDNNANKSNLKQRKTGNDENKDKPKKEKKAEKNQESEKSSVAGYLNIIADTAHNFTDGMAIAASFLADPRVSLFIE